jgi:hypothetical protein
VLYGFSRGSVRYREVQLSTRVRDFLDSLKEESGLGETPWGLVVRDEGIWMQETEVIGRYPIPTLVRLEFFLFSFFKLIEIF